MRKTAIGLGILLVFVIFLHSYTQSRVDERLFQEAKVLIFDKEWEEALEKLDELMGEYPESPWFTQALFWKGKCLEEQSGREAEALEVYKEYLMKRDKNASLAEESEISIIDLSFKLYEKGRRSHLKEIESRLRQTDRVVRYYAAITLSYVRDKRAARKGIPILREILDEEKDDRLRDRAKIALLRIDPEALENLEERRYESKAKILHIRVVDKQGGNEKFSFNIPWALADLALSVIPEEEKVEIKKEGYDIDKIINELTEMKGKIIRIETKNSIINIWID
jgi:hypothetical protein